MRSFCFICLLFVAGPLFSEVSVKQEATGKISVSDIENDLRYLENKGIDISSFKTELKRLNNLKTGEDGSVPDEMIAQGYLNLHRSVKVKVDQLKRLDLLYIVMIGFCCIAIIGFLLYSLRKYRLNAG